jgi:hypothetical protein
MGHVEPIHKKRNAYKVFLGKPHRKKMRGIHTCRPYDNIKTNLPGIG